MPADASPRKLLISAVADCLRRISRADGFYTDLGAAVTEEPFRMQDQLEGDGEEPAGDVVVSVAIARQTRPTDPARRRTHRLTRFAICARRRTDLDGFQQAVDELTDDIERALEGQQKRFPVGWEFPEYFEMVPVPAPQGVSWAGVNVYFDSHIPIRTPTR